MFEDYQPAHGRFDEMHGQDGRLREHWRDVRQSLEALNQRQLSERRWELQRLLLEHGVTYNIYGQDNKRPRPWALDLVPLLMTSREWREIEVAVAQRADLLRLVLRDLYGPQTLLRRGLLPAELVFRHPGFLLPCWEAESRLENHLIIYAADLGRAPDGQLWITGDRTQAPSGIGYSLEARTILSRVLPSLFREANVHPVLPFLRSLRSALLRLAEDEPDAIGVLTPGPANETYSEHAYLARQLGFPLLEGSDLQVRKGQCWMLGTDGRHRLRVLLRRLDDGYCEPLELNRQSLLGTPGLLQGVRSRQLSFANPLGAGVVENPGLMPFLPQICRALLGEELKLPSVPSWWCGDPQARKQIQSSFQDVLVRDISQFAPPVATAQLDAEKREQLLARIQADPGAYVVQTRLAHAGAPVLTRRGLESRGVEMRTFAVAHGGSFQVMSGGLARAGLSADSWRISGQLGGVSKDVWVLSSEPRRDAQILPHLLPTMPRSLQLNEPHVADNLLWLARYAMRAEILSRLLRATVKRLLENGPDQHDPITQQLCRAVTWQCVLYPGFVGPQGQANLDAPTHELLRVIKAANVASLRGCCQALMASAQPVRDLLTTEIFALLGPLDDDLRKAEDLASAGQSLAWVSLRLSALNGHLIRSLPEGSRRHLIEIGFALEFALGSCRLLESLALDAEQIVETGPLLMDLLNSTTGFADSGDLGDQGALLHSLLLAEDNPCSVRHQLMLLERNLRALPGRGSSDRLEASAADKLVEIGAIDLSALLAGPEPAAHCASLLQGLQSWLRDCAARVEKRYTPRRPAPASQLVRTA